MVSNTKIEWTEASWNPITGCTKISPGCKNCYAERMAKRLHGAKNPSYLNGFDLTLHPHLLEAPLKWKKPKTIFVNSMSDMFHKDVPLDFILDVFKTMEKAHWHTFQILTKRSDILLRFNSDIKWPANVWMGVSVEIEKYSFRIDHLKQTHAKTKFISFEPLLGFIEYNDFKGIDWIIVGGESGAGARPIEKAWIDDIKDNCVQQHKPFFFKQWGGFNKKKNGRLLDGELWDQLPDKALKMA